jgi:hypothetical protein
MLEEELEISRGTISENRRSALDLFRTLSPMNGRLSDCGACQEFSQHVDDDPVVTGDETCVSSMILQTKRQHIEWRLPSSPRQKKSISKVKKKK